MRADTGVLLYGAGREARSTRNFLKTRWPQSKVYVTVDSGGAEIEDAERLAPDQLDQAIAEGRFGVIVKSPGVSLHKPIFARAEAAGIDVTSNLNLWGETYRAGRLVIAITGTKGKSTTATLTQLMLAHSGCDAGLAGNVGLAPLDIADRHKIVVLELSSYQTADMAFLPDLAGITNLSAEHVDWHGSVEQYYTDKLNLIARPGPMAIALGAGAAQSTRVLAALGDPNRLLPLPNAETRAAIASAASGSRLKGAHNLDNAMLAAQLALGSGATLDGIVAGIEAFTPLPHRLEEHRFGGIVCVNDSISTTPEATKAALAAYTGSRLALIAGGHEREQTYDELAGLLAGYGVTTLVCLPVTGPRLAQAARLKAPGLDVIEAPTLEAGMDALAARRSRFDTVILSPGAPSYGQLERPGVTFTNFEERGRAFVRMAQERFA